MAVRRTNIPSQPPPNPSSALLSFSSSLTRSTTGGVFSEALACVFAATGLQSGVVHEVTPTGLELVAEEGLPQALRTHIGSIASTSPAWFVVQNAAKRRRLLVEEDAVGMFDGRASETVLRNAGWNALASAPMVIGRDVLGVLTVAAPGGEYLTPQRLIMLETVANMVALFLARPKTMTDEAPLAEGPTSLTEIDEKLTRLATLGALTLGFADDLRAVSAQLTAFLKQQEKWLEQLRLRFPAAAPVIRDLEPLHEEAASSLMLLRASSGRLLAALDETNAEIIDCASVVYDVVGHLEPIARSRNVDVIVAVQPHSEPLIRGKRSEIRQLVLGLVSDGIEACGREDKPDNPAMPAPQMQMVSVSVTREKNKVMLLFEHSGKSVATEHRQTTRVRSSRPRQPLGLLLARNIIAACSGVLEVTRSDLGGALVRVVLPAATPPPSSKRNKGGPASSKRVRSEAVTLDQLPVTKRDGWTAKPQTIKGDQPLAIRAPLRTVGSSEENASPDVDVLASTERGSALAASAHHQAAGGKRVVISDVDGAPSIAAPPSTRRRSQAGTTTKRRS